jgi:hypothetical protein
MPRPEPVALTEEEKWLKQSVDLTMTRGVLFASVFFFVAILLVQQQGMNGEDAQTGTRAYVYACLSERNSTVHLHGAVSLLVHQIHCIPLGTRHADPALTRRPQSLAVVEWIQGDRQIDEDGVGCIRRHLHWQWRRHRTVVFH